ncbi:DUF3307 domain-containing protein [Pararhodonellum marinum]|uniref:DUF3307 domain-containing protein n=1 Tax=Pararhodonellum marinum TaxID=2755358 RepID=UPI00188DE97E|nr:DUF3307 domain-containing protein [Pararhodonellum marinum]
MIHLIKLLLAHLIGDFLLQPKPWLIDKEKNKLVSPILYVHLLLHGGLVLLLFWDLKLWPLALALTVAHGLIDVAKLYFQRPSNRSKWFLADQALHILTILLAWYFWFKPTVNFQAFLSQPTVWIYLTALVFLTFSAGIIIQVLLANWSAKLADGHDESLANAGKYIGMLERLFVFLFIVSGHWEAVGFLLAAKSVFRFGDLKESKDRKLTEYILIGTLLSFGMAILTGMTVQYLTNWI